MNTTTRKNCDKKKTIKTKDIGWKIREREKYQSIIDNKKRLQIDIVVHSSKIMNEVNVDISIKHWYR